MGTISGDVPGPVLFAYLIETLIRWHSAGDRSYTTRFTPATEQWAQWHRRWHSSADKHPMHDSPI